MSDREALRATIEDIWAHAADDFARIEAEAKAQWRVELEADVAKGPEFGRPIAWAVARYKGVTDTISDVHRVGVPNGKAPYTSCGMPIPDAKLWMRLTPAIVEAMPVRAEKEISHDHMRRCKYCAADASHFFEEQAA